MSVPRFSVTAIAPRSELGELPQLTALLNGLAIELADYRDLPVPRSLASRRAARTYALEDVEDAALLRSKLEALSDSLSIDLVLQTAAVRQEKYRLAVFDMDSTLIRCEVIDELARRAGVGEAVAGITERAMRGELDFNASFTERLGMLRGLDESVLEEIAETLPITEGMPELIATLRGLGIRTAILSGGFTYFAERLQSRFGFDEVHANELSIEGGKVTGQVDGEIINGDTKRYWLERMANDLAITPQQVIAVGDGANDLPMLGVAGLGVAFDAKAVVRRQAVHNLRHVGLDGVLYLVGAGSEAVSSSR